MYNLYFYGLQHIPYDRKFGREFILALKVSQPPAKKANRTVVPHHVTDNETVALRESTIASGYLHSESYCVRPVYNPAAGGTIEGSSDTGRASPTDSPGLPASSKEGDATIDEDSDDARAGGVVLQGSEVAASGRARVRHVWSVQCVHQRRDRGRVQFGVQGASDAPQGTATSCSTAASATARKGRREWRGWSPSEC